MFSKKFPGYEMTALYVFSVLQDLRNSLPTLLENIFGFGSEPGWQLDIISKSQNPHEFDAVLRLLAPDGPLLSFIYNLQTDLYLSYEFPFTCLPVSSFFQVNRYEAALHRLENFLNILIQNRVLIILQIINIIHTFNAKLRKCLKRGYYMHILSFKNSPYENRK